MTEVERRWVKSIGFWWRGLVPPERAKEPKQDQKNKMDEKSKFWYYFCLTFGPVLLEPE